MKTALFVVLCAGLASATTVVQSQAHEQKAFFKDVPGPSGLDEKNLRIFNGGVATRSQFPFQAAVYLNFASFCGGSLIHPKWVLTAAHCVSGFRKWAVFLGMDNILKAKQEGRITLITNWGVYHEDYDSSSITNDIGVLQLPREVQLTEHIQLSKLAPADVNYAGRTARVSGFGRVADDGAGQVSPVLKYADLTVASNKVCYDFYSESHVSQICLTAEGTSSCKGDSGGPLTLKDDSGSVIQIGLTSFGCRRGCTFGCPVGFTRINIFYDWLSEKTGINFPI